MAGPSEDNLTVEVREEEMISPLNGVSSLRIAHFLRPSVSSVDGPVFDPPLDSVNPNMIDNSVPLKVNFVGWRQPQKDWKTWVNRMQYLHHSTWKQAGIHDAIMNSTFEIHRNADLILGVVEKWCSKTNTFVFPWGEATITLEDIMVLGCFSVLGDSVLSPTGDLELEMIIDKLQKARSEINQSFSPKRAWVEADYFGVKDKKTGAELLEGGSNENKSVGHAKSCCRNTLEAPGIGLEERICTIEKLCAWLKAGNRRLDDIKLRKRET
ncbi:Aminotransferase-like [Abeliophyllum distichum]|uniref:Aminotransferase-like n=1 Tax=Abeliophyllum distichum TaxID=126358 RepID=A0ABD1QJ74_9LAMI